MTWTETHGVYGGVWVPLFAIARAAKHSLATGLAGEAGVGQELGRGQDRE